MQFRPVFRLIALTTMLFQAAGELVITPHNSESKVGDTTYFNCSTDLETEEIYWYHGVKYTIYNGFGILQPYNGRFWIDRNASKGSHNLVIHSVKPGDAGEYICADDHGLGTRRTAHLVVLDNDPDCGSNMRPDGVIGQNSFNIPPDEVQLTCNVTYHGNIPPQMEWKKVGDYISIKDDVTSNVASINRLIYTLKIKGDIYLDNSSYFCQTTRSRKNQFKCTSESIKILYFVGGNTTEQTVFRDERIACVASNSTFRCNSQWYRDNYSCPLSCEENITAHLLGLYLCTVRCHVRGKDYYFDARKVLVVQPIASPLQSISVTRVASVVVPIIIIIVLLVITIALTGYYIKRRNFKQVLKDELLDLHEEKQRELEILLDCETEKTNVAEEEIELLYKVMKEEKTKREIIGLAMLNEKLFLVYEMGSTLAIYDFSNFDDKLTCIRVKDLVDPDDMCSCSTNNCLYIMDDKTSHNEVMKLNSTGKLLKKWSTKGNSGFLSATAEGNVIMTVKARKMLLEYSPDGKLIRAVPVPDCTNPWHAIKRDDRYIVSHGDYLDALNRVCLVDKEGNIEMSFGHDAGSTENQLNIPFHFAVGSNGCVIVVDHLNSRVLLLNQDLEFIANIVPKYKQRFRLPRGVCVDEQRLVVVARGDPRNPEVEEATEGEASEEMKELLKNSEKWKIEKDCRLLVFNIEPLLKKYTITGQHDCLPNSNINLTGCPRKVDSIIENEK